MKSFVAIDFETADTGADSACSIGLVRVENNQIVDEFMTLIKPPREEVHFTHIHGLTWNDLKEAPTFSEAWPQISRLIEGSEYLVAHNSSFDKRVLYACCREAGLKIPSQPFQCTVQIARQHFKIYPTKLSNVCQVLGIELNHHEALSDARASAQIAIRALKEKENIDPIAEAFVESGDAF